MKKFFSNKFLLYGLGTILFLLLWYVISIIIDERTMIFPDPITTISYIFSDIIQSQYIYKCLGWTMYKMIIGFVISFIAALLTGLLAGNYKVIEDLLKPTIVALKAIPTACLVFIFLVIFTAKWAPVLVVILICYPILYESVLGGIKNVDKEVIEAARIDGSNTFNIATRIKLPLAIPYIIVGMASSFALSFKIEIMAEVITGDTRFGLGSAIVAAQRNDPSNMIPIFAYSFIAILIMLLFSLATELIKKLLKK